MEKSKKIISQIYGYLICLVAVITFLICIANMVNAIIDLGDPIHSGWSSNGTAKLNSYEIYKLDVMKSTKDEKGDTNSAYVPSETEIKAMYESERSDKIQKVKHDSNKSIIVCSLLILISVVLFITHWRWMRKIIKSVD
jgi:hypothetical protein